MEPLRYDKTTQLGVEVLTATFSGCGFPVCGGLEMTVQLEDDKFTGVISDFNISRVSRTEIQTTVTLFRSAEWSKAHKPSRDSSTHGIIERN